MRYLSCPHKDYWGTQGSAIARRRIYGSWIEFYGVQPVDRNVVNGKRPSSSQKRSVQKVTRGWVGFRTSTGGLTKTPEARKDVTRD
jgi:hypothetical protein